MTRVAGLDLSGLEQFKASALLAKAETAAGVPQDIALDRIDFDPLQPRRSLDEVALAGLADSIKEHGVLEPVSLRSCPNVPGRFVVNRGERRVRASRLAGKVSVPAWIDDRLDRYAQVVENLQREDLTPFDLAQFIAEREKEGDSRTAIAARLHKPASFITEVAALLDAPESIRALYASGRTRDTRVLYRLSRVQREQPSEVSQVLNGNEPITRASLQAVGAVGVNPRVEGRGSSNGRKVEGSKKADALLIEHEGRRGRLGWSGWPGRRTGEVRFDDGTRKVLELAELRLIAWTAR